MPRKKDRPPRYRLTKTPRETRQTLILANELMGRIIGKLRRRLEMNQRSFAKELDWPQAMVSKLERGDVAVTWDHVDAVTAVFTRVDLDRRGPRYAEERKSWQLFHLADMVADEIEELRRLTRAGDEVQAYAILWKTERLINNPERYCRGRALEDLISEHWPESYQHWL